VIHLNKLSQPNTSAEDVSINDTDAKEHSRLFFEGYDRILSKLYPTKGMKSYETFANKDRLTAAFAGRAKVIDKLIQEIKAPATKRIEIRKLKFMRKMRY
jgi:hypothetical protein